MFKYKQKIKIFHKLEKRLLEEKDLYVSRLKINKTTLFYQYFLLNYFMFVGSISITIFDKSTNSLLWKQYKKRDTNNLGEESVN